MGKKALILILVVVQMITNVLLVSAVSDNYIMNDAIIAEYTGTEEAKRIIQNIDFEDVEKDNWAREAITRMGSLNIVKGYNSNGRYLYRPNNYVQKQEALAFILRALGMEGQAQIQAEIIKEENDLAEETLQLWSLGYLQLAANMGLITQENFEDSIVPEQGELDPNYNFIRSEPATREQLAEWIVKAIESVNPQLLTPVRGQQKIYQYNDWEEISSEKIPYVESVTINNIMKGYDDGEFKPKGSLTRAQMAQVLKNVDDIYYETQNIERKEGIIASITDNHNIQAGTKDIKRNVLIRTEDGKVEKITYNMTVDSIEQVNENDVVVYKDGEIQGLLSLTEGNDIEYLIDKDNNTMLYIYNRGAANEQKISGILQPLNEFATGVITIGDGEGNTNSYTMIDGIYGTDTDENGLEQKYMIIDDKKIMENDFPVDNWVKLTTQKNIIVDISYLGQPDIFTQIRGMVTENNPTYGYLTIIDENKKEITKHYYKNDIIVEKKQFYDDEDEIGYIDEVFPDFRYDPMDTTIDEIEKGDIVYIRLSEDDPNYITHVSAKPNYMMYYGKVTSITSKGIMGSKMYIELEDLTNTVLDISNDTPVLKGGETQSLSEIEPGDWVKVLVNQAVISPGYEEIIVKEIIIDKDSHDVTNIYRGQLSHIYDRQQQFLLKNTFRLTKLGWIEYKTQRTLDLSSEDVEYYLDGERISRDYAERYLRSNGDVYIAMEKYYGDERVKKVSFRSERDEVLDMDTVIYSDGTGNIKLKNFTSTIEADDGTIIVRNGRLVEEQNVLSPDYVQVILNGKNKAAVIDISAPPMTDNIKIYRGRISSIVEGESLQFQSHAELNDMVWSYSPVQNRFTFDFDTVIMDESGMININDFIDYTEASLVDEVFTVFTNGSHAKYIVRNPYVKEGVRGEIYNIGESMISIKDTSYYDTDTLSWKDFSRKNIGAEINFEDNTIIIKNGDIVSKDKLELGDKIKVMSIENLNENYLANDARNVTGYIIYVEG